jgi:hypothetical protein
MPDGDEEMTVVCMPVTKLLFVIPGSIVVTCARCKSQVWLSAETAARAGPVRRTICTDCYLLEEAGFAIQPISETELRAVVRVLKGVTRG